MGSLLGNITLETRSDGAGKGLDLHYNSSFIEFYSENLTVEELREAHTKLVMTKGMGE